MKNAMICALAALTLLATGCNSDNLNEVTGKVTLDGKAVAGLEVRFEPKDPSIGTTAIGYTQADGTYKLHYPGDKTGTPAGDYSVSISGGEAGLPPHASETRGAACGVPGRRHGSTSRSACSTAITSSPAAACALRRSR